MECPAEIIANILLRLPAKSLARCKLVSKSWHTLISSRQFNLVHIKLSFARIANQHLARFTNPMTTLDLSGAALDCSPLKRVNLPFRTGPQSELVGSCHGLLCISDYPGFVGLFNPTNSTFRVVPFEVPTQSHRVVLGFGYDYFCDDYKLVRVDQSNGPGAGKVHVFSLDGGGWREVDSGCPLFLGHHGKFLDNSLHWIASTGTSDYVIVAFNMSTEEFVEIKLPTFDKDAVVSIPLLVTLGQNLAIQVEYSDRVVRVWLMEVYGVESSWVQIMMLYCDSLWFPHGSRGVKPIAVSDDGSEVLMELDKILPEYYWYKVGTETFRKVEIVGETYSSFYRIDGHPCNFGAVVYVDSLFSLDNTGIGFSGEPDADGMTHQGRYNFRGVVDEMKNSMTSVGERWATLIRVPSSPDYLDFYVLDLISPDSTSMSRLPNIRAYSAYADQDDSYRDHDLVPLCTGIASLGGTSIILVGGNLPKGLRNTIIYDIVSETKSEGPLLLSPKLIPVLLVVGSRLVVCPSRLFEDPEHSHIDMIPQKPWFETVDTYTTGGDLAFGEWCALPEPHLPSFVECSKLFDAHAASSHTFFISLRKSSFAFNFTSGHGVEGVWKASRKPLPFLGKEAKCLDNLFFGFSRERGQMCGKLCAFRDIDWRNFGDGVEVDCFFEQLCFFDVPLPCEDRLGSQVIGVVPLRSGEDNDIHLCLLESQADGIYDPSYYLTVDMFVVKFGLDNDAQKEKRQKISFSTSTKGELERLWYKTYPQRECDRFLFHIFI